MNMMTHTENQTETSESPALASAKPKKPILTHAERMAAKRAENLRQNLSRRKEQARSRQQAE
jgi:hypothetical protein